MNYSLEDVLKMKKRITKAGCTVYDWFFKELETIYLQGESGLRRIAIVSNFFNEEAQSYIVYQLYYLNESAGMALREELNLTNPTICDEHYKDIIKYHLE